MRRVEDIASRAPAKDAVRRALAVVAGLTVRDIARRLGVSPSLLTAVRDPRSTHQLGAERMRQLAAILRVEADRLRGVADQLDRASGG